MGIPMIAIIIEIIDSPPVYPIPCPTNHPTKKPKKAPIHPKKIPISTPEFLPFLLPEVGNINQRKA